MKELLKQKASEIDVMLTEKQLSQFVRYYQLLVEWNEKMNLTAITEPEEVVQKHFVDSLSCLETGLLKSGKVIDVGTGAGFPAIPLKIACPELEMVLLDSLQKRLIFLEEVIKELGLENVSLVHSRAEDGAQKAEFREQFDVCIARAVAPMNVLAELCLPFVKQGGYWIAMKGSRGEEELELAKNSISILGGKTRQFITTKIDGHTVISVEKVEKTSKKYPRKAGMPSKNPLI